MDPLSSTHDNDWPEPTPERPPLIVPEIVEEGLVEPAAPPRRRRRWLVPLVLFVLTWMSVIKVGGWEYAIPLMTILICHEAGHFLQALRYGVHASFPYFIPIPLRPIGTMGAVIAMDARMGDRRTLFDIGITGPLAGLVPTLIFCVVGLHRSSIVPVLSGGELGEPLLFHFLARWIVGTPPAGTDIGLGPMAYAGWVGLLITSINLFPIGQLDGGHILYGLLRRGAHRVAWLLLWGALATILFAALVLGIYELLGWLVMISLLLAMGPRHPPTANDYVPLGPWRTALGWLTLAFVPLGFTPMPFMP